MSRKVESNRLILKQEQKEVKIIDEEIFEEGSILSQTEEWLGDKYEIQTFGEIFDPYDPIAGGLSDECPQFP